MLSQKLFKVTEPELTALQQESSKVSFSPFTGFVCPSVSLDIFYRTLSNNLGTFVREFDLEFTQQNVAKECDCQ